MTVEEVQDRVKMIAAVVDDVEEPHWLEDHLYWDVMKAIANGAENPVKLAKAALETKNLKITYYWA